MEERTGNEKGRQHKVRGARLGLDYRLRVSLEGKGKSKLSRRGHSDSRPCRKSLRTFQQVILRCWVAGRRVINDSGINCLTPG